MHLSLCSALLIDRSLDADRDTPDARNHEKPGVGWGGGTRIIQTAVTSFVTRTRNVTVNAQDCGKWIATLW